MVLATTIACSLVIGFVDEPNAADAWNEFFQEIEDVEYPYDYDFEWTDEIQARYEELSPVFQQIQEISAIEHCDWELDYSKGLDLLVPHLSQLRKAQLLLSFSMDGDIRNGKTSSAIEQLNSMLDITKHQNTTSLTIGSLVAASSFSMASQHEDLIDATNDLAQLDSMLEKINSFDSFDPFGIRASVGEERKNVLDWLQVTENPDFSIITSVLNQADVDKSGWDMKQEIENYSKTMKKMEVIFQMPNKEEAMKATVALEQETKELGNLTELLSFSASPLLDTAFTVTSNVEVFKALLEQRIEMLRNPNSATYFLKAVKVYNELDPEERVKALTEGDWSVLNVPVELLSRAVEMEPAKITLAETPATPLWIPSLLSLTLDMLGHGNIEDMALALQVAGHMSQQDRIASSLAAACIVRTVVDSLPDQMITQEREQLLKSTRSIPTADAFMVLASAESDTRRLAKFLCIEKPWNPSIGYVMAETMKLREDEGVCDAWGLFVDRMGVPENPFDNNWKLKQFNTNLQEAKTLPLLLRKKLSRPKGR